MTFFRDRDRPPTGFGGHLLDQTTGRVATELGRVGGRSLSLRSFVG